MLRRLLAKALPKLWSNYGPVILSQRSETSFGSHPCRVVSVSYEQNGCCHGRGREFESRRPRHSFQSLTRCPFGAFPVHFEDWAHFSEGRQEIAGVFASAQAPSAMAG